MKNSCQEPPCTWRTSILLRFLMVIMMVGVISIELDFAWGFQKYIILWVLTENKIAKSCQEPSHTLRMSFIILRFLMVILMVVIIFFELHFVFTFPKMHNTGVLSGRRKRKVGLYKWFLTLYIKLLSKSNLSKPWNTTRNVGFLGSLFLVLWDPYVAV